MIWIDERGVCHRNCAVFLQTAGEFGGLSNMAGGYPLVVNGVTFLTSEALYQCCRFPLHPAIQQEIIDQASPLAAKMIAHSLRYRPFIRPDWNDIRVNIMRWCLALKLACNVTRFTALLLFTGCRPIVEKSRRDGFWGAIPTGDTLIGRNVLGKLLVDLRARVHTTGERQLLLVPALPIANLRLLGQDTGAVDLN